MQKWLCHVLTNRWAGQKNACVIKVRIGKNSISNQIELSNSISIRIKSNIPIFYQNLPKQWPIVSQNLIFYLKICLKLFENVQILCRTFPILFEINSTRLHCLYSIRFRISIFPIFVFKFKIF